ncbi:MAG: hypothetical protein N2647_05650 [Thermodesulfovibrio sp.]|nr:hypothetical protein [Thermodesulfovibrio sp.]
MKMIKKFFIVLVILFFYQSSLYAEQRYNLPIDNSPFIGTENASVTIIEFIDYQ